MPAMLSLLLAEGCPAPPSTRLGIKVKAAAAAASTNSRRDKPELRWTFMESPDSFPRHNLNFAILLRCHCERSEAISHPMD
jgi:hypothetical protein